MADPYCYLFLDRPSSKLTRGNQTGCALGLISIHLYREGILEISIIRINLVGLSVVDCISMTYLSGVVTTKLKACVKVEEIINNYKGGLFQ